MSGCSAWIRSRGTLEKATSDCGENKRIVNGAGDFIGTKLPDDTPGDLGGEWNALRNRWRGPQRLIDYMLRSARNNARFAMYEIWVPLRT